MVPLLIDNYDSYSYNLYHLIASVFESAPVVLYNDEVKCVNELESVLHSGSISCVVLSPGPGNPDNVNDLNLSHHLLSLCSNCSKCSSIPVLGTPPLLAQA